MNHKIPRSTEIDILRTAAIMMMIVYHTVYDLEVYLGWGIDVFSLPWTLLALSSATIFLLLVGVSFVISWERNASWNKIFLRALKVLGYALVVSIATFFMDSETFVRFGVLHLIGFSLLLLPLFSRLRVLNLILGCVIILSSFVIEGIHTKSWLLLPLGLTPTSFTSVDYFPMIPWFGVVLIGVQLGHHFLSHPDRYVIFHEETARKSMILRGVRSISSHSLLIYMLHQPILLSLLTLLK